MPMPLFGRSRGRRRAEPIVQAPIFTESVLDLCPDVAPPSYPIRMPTPIPVATTSTNANANGVAPYPREYVSAAPRSYTDPNPFTTTEVEYDVSASDSAQFPENLHLAYTAASTSTSTSTAVPRLPRAVSLSAFADAVVWNSSARRATDDMERLEIREAPKPRLPRLTIPGEDGRSNESLLTQTQDGNWTATRQEASENRPEQQSQIQSQSQSGPKPKVESGYGYGPESSSAGHAQHQGQGSSQQRNSVGRATGFMGSVGVVLSASASAFRAADGNQNRLPDSTFHPERRGPQRESSFARLSPFRWFGKGKGRSSSRTQNSDAIEKQSQVPNNTECRDDSRDPDWGWIWNHQATSPRDRAVSVSTSMSAPAAPGATIGQASGRNRFPPSAFAAHRRSLGIDGNPTGHGHRHEEATIGLGLGFGYRDSSPAQHVPPTTYPAGLSAPALSVTRTTVRPVSTGSSPPLPPLPAPYPPPPAARALRTAEVPPTPPARPPTWYATQGTRRDSQWHRHDHPAQTTAAAGISAPAPAPAPVMVMAATSTPASIQGARVVSSPTRPSESSPAHLTQSMPARINDPREHRQGTSTVQPSMLPPLHSPYHWLPSPPRRSLSPQASTSTSTLNSSPLASHQGEQGFGIHTAHRAEQGPDEIHTQDANSDWSDSDSVSERSSTSILYLSLPGGASKRREGRDTNTNTEVEADRSGDDEARYTWRYYGYNLPDPPTHELATPPRRQARANVEGDGESRLFIANP